MPKPQQPFLDVTSTTTASTNNHNSMYIQDEDAYIAIHHHHFDKQAYLTSLNGKRHTGPVFKSASQSQIQSGLVIPITNLVSKSQVLRQNVQETNVYNIKTSTVFRSKEHRGRPGSIGSGSNYGTLRQTGPTSNHDESIYWTCKWQNTNIRGGSLKLILK